jgi:hypothetical protein
MTNPHDEFNDDLHEILSPKPIQPTNELRLGLLRRTETRLIQQRRVRTMVRSGSIAAVFLLGGMIGWVARPTPQPERVENAIPQVVVLHVPVAVPVLIPAENGSAGTSEITQRLSGSQTEMQAEQEDDPKASAKLYKLAGDAFLREENYPNATRCYRLFLVRAGDSALSIDPDDTWLLTSLKNAVFQEKSNVSKTNG